MKSKSIKELAALYGVQMTYEDAAGKRRDASKESLAAVLRNRSGIDDPSEALRARRRDLARRVVEPVTVVWGDSRLAVRIRLPLDFDEARINWQLHLEDGSTRAGSFDVEACRVDERTAEYVARTARTSERLPHGYHVLSLTVRGQQYETFVIASPMRAYAPEQKSWGVFAPLYAATTRRSWGAGDLGDMQQWREWVSGLGGGIVATLPMLPIDPSDPSPYSPVSRLFWNEMYLDVERLAEYRPEDRDEAAIDALRKSERVDYAGVMGLKRAVLQRMAGRFRPEAAFEEFAGRASAYAEFMAERESAGEDTRATHAGEDTRATHAGEDTRATHAGEDTRATRDYHLYVQYRMAQQMRAVADDARRSGLGLYLDFPLGVNPKGFDAVHYADSFVKRMSVGAPPDLFFTKGQNWGFPPIDPDAIRDQRYEYFRACVRHHASHAGVLRIDHVMGLHRLFWIPEGAEAKDGVYVRYPEEELYAILILESNRNRCAVVGEDLGTVPQYVPGMMKKHGLRRMYVVQYEIEPEGEQPAGAPAEAAVASVNTHDMPTFAGFWAGRDIDDRVQQGLLDDKGAAAERAKRQQIREALTTYLTARGLLPEGVGQTRAVLEALLRFLGASAAEIVLVNLEDLWLETEPQNVPGVPERSWRQKFRYTLEEVRSNADVARILSELNVIRREVDGNQTQEARNAGSGSTRAAETGSRHTGRVEEERRATRDGR